MKFNPNMLDSVVIRQWARHLTHQDSVPGKGTGFSLFHNTWVLGLTQLVISGYLQASFYYPRQKDAKVNVYTF
jgi:hypothetical protein